MLPEDWPVVGCVTAIGDIIPRITCVPQSLDEDMFAQDACIALIFAGGTGTRMTGADVPKQFLELEGKPIIAYTIDHFEQHPQVDGIVVVCLESWLGPLEHIVAAQGYQKVIALAPGGRTGQESIYNGLLALEEQVEPDADVLVLVHDGVRPLIDEDTITRCIESVRTQGCTAVISPAVETVVTIADDGTLQLIDRSRCRLARAPQGFSFRELLAAHRRAREEGETNLVDSVSLMSRYGYQIHTVDGPAENIKITTPSDFFAFKGYMEQKMGEQG